MKMKDLQKASPEGLLQEIDRLRGMLWHAGVCADCGCEIQHDIDEPFAWCQCDDGGTSEATVIPTIAALRHQLHLISFILFKMTDGKVSGSSGGLPS